MVPLILDAIRPLPVPPSVLGESPFWHPDQQCLYWIDIPGRRLNRFHPQTSAHQAWDLEAEPGSIAPLPGGDLLMAMRDGLWRFDPARGRRQRLAPPPYDPALQRFNDGKADAQGRFWVGSLDDQRRPEAALYCWRDGAIERLAAGISVSNGLGFSPDGLTLYWSDTKAHRIQAFDLHPQEGSLSRPRVFCEFPQREPGLPLDQYGGRPDGAAVDSEGAYWVAMFEGQRLLRLSAEGEQLAELPLPVRCPTMPCFGGHDLKTLYITTGREKRPAEELAAQPWAGCVLQVRVAVPGLPVHFARG